MPGRVDIRTRTIRGFVRLRGAQRFKAQPGGGHVMDWTAKGHTICGWPPSCGEPRAGSRAYSMPMQRGGFRGCPETMRTITAKRSSLATTKIPKQPNRKRRNNRINWGASRASAGFLQSALAKLYMMCYIKTEQYQGFQQFWPSKTQHLIRLFDAPGI